MTSFIVNKHKTYSKLFFSRYYIVTNYITRCQTKNKPVLKVNYQQEILMNVLESFLLGLNHLLYWKASNKIEERLPCPANSHGCISQGKIELWFWILKKMIYVVTLSHGLYYIPVLQRLMWVTMMTFTEDILCEP